jgi:hypothetical protein
MISAKDCAAKAAEMDDKANECFSAESADQFRIMADAWRQLQEQVVAQDAWAAKNQ